MASKVMILALVAVGFGKKTKATQICDA